MSEIKLSLSEYVPALYVFSCKAGKQTVTIEFDDKYPPVQKLFTWLERIAIGEKQVSETLLGFSIPVLFTFTCLSDDFGTLSINSCDSRFNIKLKAEIITVDLVKSFYNAILAFVNDDAFMDYIYSRVTPGKRLYNKLKLIRPRLIKELLKLDRNSLQNLIYSVDPVYKNTVSSKTKSNKTPKLMSSFPLISNEFDSMTNEQKVLYLYNYLKTGHNYVKMTNKPNFESEAIQQYLDNHRK